MAEQVLTTDQVKKALSVDDDFDIVELDRYAHLASSFVKQRTRYDCTKAVTVHPLAIQLGELYIKQMYYNGSGDFNRNHDYTIGISSLIVDLQCIADSIKIATAVDDLITKITTPITLDSATSIVAARTAYDALFEMDKDYVTQLSLLVTYEAALLEVS